MIPEHSIASLLAENAELKDENARLRGALVPFSEMAAMYVRHQPSHIVLRAYDTALLVDDLRVAAELVLGDSP